jgi:hypothetical protein
MVQANSKRMTAAQVLDFANLLAKNALAVSEQDLAVTIFEQAIQNPFSTTKTAADYAQACRVFHSDGMK